MTILGAPFTSHDELEKLRVKHGSRTKNNTAELSSATGNHNIHF